MRKLFIVDDEPFILEGLSSVIDWEEFGIKLSGKASDGRDAFEALKQSGVDILITDIRMPEMNGLELIRRLKPLYPDMKFIVLSGYNEFDYLREGMRLGIENYLLKPINIKELTETVSSTVQKIENADRYAYLNRNQLDILRNNVLNRWLTGKFDPLELKNRLQLLEIPTDNSFYTVAAIKTVQDINGSSSRSMLWEQENGDVYSLCREQAERTDSCFCFNDLDGDIILIFTGSDAHYEQPKALALLSHIRNELKQSLGVQVLITLGSQESSYLDVSQSCHHAKRLQEYFLTNAEDEIVRYDQMLGDALRFPESITVDWFEYEQLLHSKDKQALYDYIDELFAKLQSMDAISPGQIHNCAIDLILCTKQAVKENKLSHELAASSYKQLFTALFRAHTIGQLAAHVKWIAGTAVDYLSTQDDEFSPVVKQVMHQIQTRYADELSLKTLSLTFNIHPFYLGQLFQKETGESFSDYLNSYRIKIAQKLLRTTAMKASEISKHVGYWEPGYFYKQFKKYTGVSPAKYRSG
ncbi:response regulator transcription factor [Paenibacillus alkaliterrae]|uniref:response regulator transcription factor n=1 Tax=Paenibacillus alkaliterrae TaxID=320909 RepID=UPI001F1CD5D8|nr:response regulator transcription factor [Paenibacillus alkaliterrae]MCF2938178.1 response regulator transcription factor [Paenibacillus alkaliterrae]